jgi:hypothetical protein
MEKVMSQQDSSALVKAKSDRKFDRCVESSEDYSLNTYKFNYYHTRYLPPDVARKALRYIVAIVAKYPFQARRGLASPLWARFCEEWCETGDELKSLKAI